MATPTTEQNMTPEEQLAPQQFANHKVKIKKSGQRSCNELNEKAKMCAGHLKRWYYSTDAIERECGDLESAWGKNAEVYRCEYCRTLYLPNAQEKTHNVAGLGRISDFGLTVPAKEEKQ